MRYERITLPAGGVAMDAYIPHVSESIDPQVQRPSVVIFPGGAYVGTSEREAEPIALRFAAAGFNAFVVWYRVAPCRFPIPQQDAAEAVAWVRSHAAEYHSHPEKIAVMGFSAGGHLAASMGVFWQREELWSPLGLTPRQVRPDAMVLCYPVITGGEYASRFSFCNLSGSKDPADHAAFSLENFVTPDTPPAFLWSTWDDEGVPVQSTLLMALALKKADVQAEVHVYPHGVHGLSLADDVTAVEARPELTNPDCQDWPQLAQRFLKQVFA